MRRECNDTFVKITDGVWRVFDEDGAMPSGDVARQLGVAVTRAHRPWAYVGCGVLVLMIVVAMTVRRNKN